MTITFTGDGALSGTIDITGDSRPCHTTGTPLTHTATVTSALL